MTDKNGLRAVPFNIVGGCRGIGFKFGYLSHFFKEYMKKNMKSVHLYLNIIFFIFFYPHPLHGLWVCNPPTILNGTALNSLLMFQQIRDPSLFMGWGGGIRVFSEKYVANRLR